LTTVKASLTTAQTSGNAITINITSNTSNILTTPSSLTFVNGQTLSNQPALSITSLTANDKLEFNITQVGDGTGVGLKITLLGTG